MENIWAVSRLRDDAIVKVLIAERWNLQNSLMAEIQISWVIIRRNFDW